MVAPTIPVILCGGAGTRLWPLSRQQAPKQFARLFNGLSLFQQTAQRALRVTGQNPVVVCSEDHGFVVEQQLEEMEIRPRSVLCEPVARNTAPALAAAAVHLQASDPGASMLALPSDHLVPDLDIFAADVNEARQAAGAGRLVTFGITPTRPHTGYGYIRQAAALAGMERAATVEAFVEKPELEQAQEYFADPKWLWNSGMFLFPLDLLLDELAALAPQVLDRARAAVRLANAREHTVSLDRASFEAAPEISIDYAVMERTEHAAVLPTALRWSDIGAWQSLWEISEKDPRGNAHTGDVHITDAANCYLHSEGPLVAAVGIRDITVVATSDAVLVADIAHSEDVKQLVHELRSARREEAETPQLVHRPWGTYERLHRGEMHQVKHIVVRPGGRLSLQRHQHRAEHWVVVRGSAVATRGDEQFLLKENDALFIPRGEVHRLENLGAVHLHLIEVQVGAYTGEDDIERLSDAYGRC